MDTVISFIQNLFSTAREDSLPGVDYNLGLFEYIYIALTIIFAIDIFVSYCIEIYPSRSAAKFDIIRLSATFRISVRIPFSNSLIANKAMYKQAEGTGLVLIRLNLEHF